MVSHYLCILVRAACALLKKKRVVIKINSRFYLYHKKKDINHLIFEVHRDLH